MSKLNKPSVIFFDLDGTLIDSAQDITRALNSMLRECDLKTASVEHVKNWVGKGSQVLVEHALMFASEHDKTFVADKFAQFHQVFLQHYQTQSVEKSIIFPHTLDMLQHLKNQSIRSAVITNKPEAIARVNLDSLDLAEYFELLVGGDTYSEKKPHPLPGKHALSFFNSLSQQALMIGDSEVDILFARSLHIPVVSCPWGYTPQEELKALSPDYMIESFSELPDLWQCD
ncbi:MAG: phosphoglycolate phosphatase [Pseudomonadota bacterium]